MKLKIIYFFIALMLSSCTTQPHKTREQLENIHFIDTEIFDKNMLQSMYANTKNINVAITGEISINQMPERLGKWLGAVVEKQGRVDVKPEMMTKDFGISAFFALLPYAYNFVKEEFSYGISGNYNATIFYNPETGLIDKLVFTQKE
jgi:hypothetical protein